MVKHRLKINNKKILSRTFRLKDALMVNKLSITSMGYLNGSISME